MDNEENGFNYELAMRVAGLRDEEANENKSSDGKSDDNHANHARDRYKHGFQSDQSTFFFGEDGSIHYTETDFGDAFRTGDAAEPGINFEEAEILAEDAPKAFEPGEVSYSDNVTLIDRYTEAVAAWNSGIVTSSDANTVADLQKIRVDTMRQILERQLVDDDRLQGLEKFVGADVAWNSRPDPRDGEYADYIRHRNLVRQRVFFDENTDDFHDRIEDVETYARASGAISQAMISKTDIAEHYEFLAVRQEAVLEHFNNPRFIAEVGLYDKNTIDDELLVDFDRGDLRSDASRERSQGLAEVFSEYASFGAGSELRTASKVQKFQLLREAGRSIASNQDAIIRFARLSQVDDSKTPIESVAGEEGQKLTPKSISQGSLEMGLQALDDKTYTTSVMKEWLDSIPKAERKTVKNEPVALFRKARETFERDFNQLAGSEGKIEGSSMAASFAVMEKSAQAILKNMPKYNRNGELNTPEDLGALALFSPEYQKETLNKLPKRIGDKLSVEMRDSDRVGVKSGAISKAPKSKGGEEYHLDLMSSGNDVHIDVADGNHLRLSNSKEDFENGKFVQLRLEGLTVPEMGQQTKNGMLDAGDESKAHLQRLVAQYGSGERLKNLGLVIEENSHGDKVLKASIEGGESLSQRMINDGYGLPTSESEGRLRRENIAKIAESQKRGLWKDGFPEVDRDWRSEGRSPSLTAKDKRDRLTDLVGSQMSTDPRTIKSNLSKPETKIFSLELDKWASMPNVDKAIFEVAKNNPGRITDIYDNNLDILKDLRKRKDKLTQNEKVAHDRLDMGRRALGKTMVELGHMDPEKVKKDGHAMMSRKGLRANLDSLRPVGNAIYATGKVANKYAGKAMEQAPGMLNSLFDMADER